MLGSIPTLRSANLRRHRRQQGCRRSSSTPSSWRAQASLTQGQSSRSLASVGGGMGHMAAGAARRAGPRSRTLKRPTRPLGSRSDLFSTIYVTLMYILLVQHAKSSKRMTV